MSVDAARLKSIQGPLKESYQSDPSSAMVTLESSSSLSDSDGNGISCKLGTGKQARVAGLHAMAGGQGEQLCSGDMLLDALVACTGVTLKAVATSFGIPLNNAIITARGELDFRGTLGISREVPVGFSKITLHFELDLGKNQDGVVITTAEQVEKLIKATERYCVVLQTLKNPVECSSIVKT